MNDHKIVGPMKKRPYFNKVELLKINIKITRGNLESCYSKHLINMSENVCESTSIRSQKLSIDIKLKMAQ